ncbi:adrenodoxin-NADP(+) reductase [Malassezia vespertilionis]|uniref:NADPH:adrenodoxin oxidoreductase, mitochondrial n=1 Tax=Malassezia vespertilionis TaxID=2020962 RepID=A0A2N1JA84_9BASI|nr:adrenodoxin-NADP(+) reductase [Malassezia vespertilionis]PKI83464.1 Arh1p [Malassezia vespertilionis]WFD07182.1 adrenodoxin-NADP(+) reductase [Malassezia vespertilionis]
MLRATLPLRLAASRAMHAQPMRLAIVGSGPSGFYVANKILQGFDAQKGTGDDGVEVHMYERLPTPYGLVRYGVAPDHPDVKNVEHKFDQVAHDARFRFFGNVCVSASDAVDTAGSLASFIPLRDLVPYYTQIVFAYGAMESRPLGIPGSRPKELRNYFCALDFVEWYNGHPDAHDPAKQDAYSMSSINGEHIRRVAVVGAGNVALDVARMILRQCAAAPKDDTMAHTDVPEPVLHKLKSFQVEEVNLYVRRGAAQLAFTNKELREMLALTHVPFRPLAAGVLDEAFAQTSAVVEMGQRRTMTRLLKQLQKGSAVPYNESHTPRWGLHLLRSPAAFLGDASTPPAVHTAEWHITQLAKGAKAAESGDTVKSREDLIISSVGYRSSALPGAENGAMQVPFDFQRFVIPSVRNRVVDMQGEAVPGMYAAGWITSGPVGVIASTMVDAYSAADEILRAWKEAIYTGNTSDTLCAAAGFPEPDRAIPEAVQNASQPVVSYEGWKKIDAAEQARGKPLRKLREKFLTVREMLEIVQ